MCCLVLAPYAAINAINNMPTPPTRRFAPRPPKVNVNSKVVNSLPPNDFPNLLVAIRVLPNLPIPYIPRSLPLPLRVPLLLLQVRTDRAWNVLQCYGLENERGEREERRARGQERRRDTIPTCLMSTKHANPFPTRFLSLSHPPPPPL